VHKDGGSRTDRRAEGCASGRHGVGGTPARGAGADSCASRGAGEGPIRRPERGGSEWEPIKILLEGD
jgi:hypothetical protein